MREKLGQFFCSEKSVCRVNSSEFATQGKPNNELNNKRKNYIGKITYFEEEWLFGVTEKVRKHSDKSKYLIIKIYAAFFYPQSSVEWYTSYNLS